MKAQKIAADWPDPPTHEELDLSWFLSHASAGRTEACLKFIARGMDVNSPGSKGQSALSEAVCAKQVETAMALLDHGADIHQRSSLNKGILHCAASWSAQDMGQLIARGADVNAVNDFGETPLISVSEPEQARVLLLAGANPNIESKSQTTAFYRAATMRMAEMCSVLAEFGADINPSAFEGFVARQAMVKNDTNMGAFLVSMGAGPRSPSAGRNAEWRKIFKMSPLHAAVYSGHLFQVKNLLEKGADPGVKHNRKTPAEFARAIRNHDIAAYLDAASARRTIDLLIDSSRSPAPG